MVQFQPNQATTSLPSRRGISAVGGLLFKASPALTFPWIQRLWSHEAQEAMLTHEGYGARARFAIRVYIIGQTESGTCSHKFPAYLQLQLQTYLWIKGYGRRYKLIRGHGILETHSVRMEWFLQRPSVYHLFSQMKLRPREKNTSPSMHFCIVTPRTPTPSSLSQLVAESGLKIRSSGQNQPHQLLS